MNSKQIDNLFRLMRLTSDRAIIPDTESERLFVIIDGSEYEQIIGHKSSLLGLSEEDMMNRINKDIALWRAQNSSENLDWYEGNDYGSVSKDKGLPQSDFDSFVKEETPPEKKPEIFDYEVEDPLYFENVESENNFSTGGPLEQQFDSVDSEESLSDIHQEDESDKFQLEPIE
ncbi:MAG: hypothetical protein COU31_00195 [Candidatus Magasanikbacteria bacterium CG10_big_fil_rev_8_21_14_0_10_40_10]|uniref:Uncharacterized protein n=1 Tax=Candidatus Magasanikbacteria bacterium CG10_big_fil_rev_8_21_14_0_10_40_10 TaxID=1974648 RepID=A0A2M6W5C1_9BACT|nr:MAG: hypothetical protein COU31_00195 [Candidatus Magasanikbacteria bacterium CG10_big_fil_rev_8_21_14_0_10_40_10]